MLNMSAAAIIDSRIFLLVQNLYFMDTLPFKLRYLFKAIFQKSPQMQMGDAVVISFGYERRH